MDVSIIIVNYKTKELCRDCINSVMEKTEGVSYEIILVDNNSADGSAECLKEMFGDKIRIIESPENIGFGRANNLGIEVSTGEFVFLLNSDTVLINNAIKILRDYIASNENVGIVGGNLYDVGGRGMHSYMLEFPSLKTEKLPCLIKRVLHKKRKDKDGKEFNSCGYTIEVGYVTGADMMIRREALNKSGYFDKEFFMYSEEVELTHRIRKNGYKVFSVPEARITHLEGASSGTKNALNEFKEKNWLNGKCLFYEKVYGKDSVLKCLKITTTSNFRGIIHDILLRQFNRIKKDIYKYRLSKAYLRRVKLGEEPYRGK